MRRVLLGGTFDPPHIAHLVAGEVAHQQLDADVVTFLPAGAPWQKADVHVSAGEHRWAMTRLAVADVDYFEADDREVSRDGWTYTIDTVESFPTTDELWLVLGADAAANLPTWNRWEEVVETVRVAVAPRPGTERAVVDDVLSGRLTWLDMPRLDVSGTEIRERANAGRSVRFLVRDQVWRYLTERRLYTANTSPSV